MSWQALTTADLAILPQLLELVQRQHPDDEGAAAIASAITRVTRYVRGCIASRPGGQNDADPALLPPELIEDAAWLVFEELLLPLAQMFDLADTQKTRIASARTTIRKDVPAGTMRVSQPDNPEATPGIQSAHGAAIVASETRNATREKLKGL